MKGKKFKKIKDQHLYHIVDLIQDDKVSLIVYKCFLIRKRFWAYEIMELFVFEDRLKCGLIHWRK